MTGRPQDAGDGSSVEVTPELRLQVTLQRYQAVRTEIQWRGVQRDATIIFAFTLVGVVFSAIDKIGAWVMLLPVALVYLAAMWLQHDRRIGSLAHYLRTRIEPVLQKYDGVIGLEEYLDTHERARSYNQSYHFSSIMSRLLFPSLQGIALGSGVGLFIAKGPINVPLTTLVTVAAVLIVGSILLTFAKVKHVRIR